VLAAHGYPVAPRRGDPITGLPVDADDLMVFHAGTAMQGGRIVTAGGRVACVTALGESLRLAQQRAYEALGGIAFDGMQYRTDIGHRAVAAGGSTGSHRA
jgi:phosphoribosylamine--glycine ligase